MSSTRSRIRLLSAALAAAVLVLFPRVSAADDLGERVEHGQARNGEVSLHYVTLGQGPVVIMLHGFPDYWYTWRNQMVPLAERYQVVAMDLRGYNRSDKPAGVANYAMGVLVADVAAVLDQVGTEKAIVIGHDWGGAIAWQFAMSHPERTERLVILNVPHPAGLTRELGKGGEQTRNSQYARNFQQEGAHESLTAEGLASWVRGREARKLYIEAFRRSDFKAMLNYYKANYPSGASSGSGGAAPASPTFPRITCPVLIIHGLEDPFLLAAGHNDTWQWIDSDMTLVTIPKAGHFVQHDASDLVTRTIQSWLGR